MATSQKIVSALHANWVLSLAGLLLSFGASVVLVRALPPALFAQYAAVLAIMALATLVFEAGANSGFTRYLEEAARQQARATFYRKMQRRRWLAAAACAAALLAFGPWYARSTQFAVLAAQPWLFALIAALVGATLARLLAHYGLLALFEAKAALLLQQGFLVGRSVALALVAVGGGSLAVLVAVMLAITVAEAVLVDRRLWRIIRTERAPLPDGFVTRAQRFGLLTVFDKACAMLGSGTVLLLLLAPRHPAATLALLALAVDLVGKVVSVTVLPMGNMVAPYLSRTGDEAGAQGLAIARVIKLSALLYAFSIGAGVLLLPWFVGAVYGASYASAAGLTLLLLVPTAFENWVRGGCSPALLRNARYRELVRVNVVQAAATLLTLAVVIREPVEIVVLTVGGVRAAVAAWNLILLRPLVPARTYAVPLQALLIALVAGGGAWSAGAALPLAVTPHAAIEGLVFTLLFAVGVRGIVFRDADVLHLAHRIAGARAGSWSSLLPARSGQSENLAPTPRSSPIPIAPAPESRADPALT